MGHAQKEYLVETSTLVAAIGASTTLHNNHFNQTVKDGDEATSIYIRKEFINVFICELIYVSAFIRSRNNVQDALTLLSQRFGNRAIKVDLIMMGNLLAQRRALTNPRSASREIARLAINWLKVFDKRFQTRVPNLSGCSIGGMNPNVDYDDIIKDLFQFREEFLEPLKDCPVNDLVGVNNDDGLGKRLVDEPSTSTLEATKNLDKLLKKKRRFGCFRCRAIGDVVIALEQPGSVKLVHLDESFNSYCSFLGNEHVQIKSAPALDKEANPPDTQWSSL